MLQLFMINKKELYIGVMSGTSLDGVDVALCQIDQKTCTLIHSIEYPMDKSLKLEILKTIKQEITLQRVGELDNRLATLFAKAINALLSSKNIDYSTVNAIGLHGQTLWHNPNGKYGFSMQLGDPNIVAVETNIRVVSDFRRKDIALGGQGAPLVPAFHEFLFADLKEQISIVNIGGMANITVLGERLIGYDTGCGNVLLDTWVNKHLSKPYDKDAKWAKSGSIDFKLLDEMLKDPYFSKVYPKSTGREYFNEEWINSYIANKNLENETIQRTILELTAISISNEVLKFNRDILVLCGGGAKNSFLVERIKILLPSREVVIANNADELEAMAFAWLAYKRVHKEVVNLKDVTGARSNAVLGGIYE